MTGRTQCGSAPGRNRGTLRGVGTTRRSCAEGLSPPSLLVLLTCEDAPRAKKDPWCLPRHTWPKSLAPAQAHRFFTASRPTAS